jgi:hypothetical protein
MWFYRRSIDLRFAYIGSAWTATVTGERKVTGESFVHLKNMFKKMRMLSDFMPDYVATGMSLCNLL